jgi:hypothetical protein
MLRSALIPALLLVAGPGALRAQTDYYARLGLVGAGTLLRDVLGTEITVRQSIEPMAAIGASMPISPGYRAGVEATFASGGFDAEQIRAGVEYVLIHGQVRWPVRAGYFSNRQTNRDATGSGPRFNGATLGLGMGVGPLLLDVAFVYETGDYVDPSLFQQSATSRRVLFSLIYRHLGRP